MDIDPYLLNRLLDEWPVARLATVGPDAAPHLVPVVFCRHEGALLSPVDGKRKSGARLRRFANLAGNARVSVLLDQYDDDWRRLWWVRLDGHGAEWYPGPDEAAAPARLLREKYAQYDAIAVQRGAPVYLRMEWHSVAGWAQSGSAAAIREALDARAAAG